MVTSPLFTVSATVIDPLDKVTVSFAFPVNVSDANDRSDDWIAVYCLQPTKGEIDNELADLHDYLDSQPTNGLVNGTILFGPLVNMRCNLQFKYITRDWHAIASSPLVRFRKGPTEPTQLRLAMGDNASQLHITWTSAQLDKSATPQVRYGLTKQQLDQHANATGVTYDASHMCMAPATIRSARLFRDPGVQYDAVMTNLKPETTYYYQVGSKHEKSSWSDIRTFRVPPAAASHDNSTTLSMFVFGDLMAPTTATRDFRVPGSCGTTMALIQADIEKEAVTADPAHNYAALFHVGDLSYAAGATYVWDHFGNLVEPVASRLPYMIEVGNHDYGYREGQYLDPVRFPRNPIFERDGTHGFDSHGECGVPTETRFRAPATGNGIWWYSVELGLTHHIVLSSEHAFERHAPMREWLEQDLAKVDRSKTPWLFVHLHRSMYCSVAFRGDYDRSIMFRDELESLFAHNHVDVVFTGHYHSYERTCPVFDDHCFTGKHGEARAPVHIMVGSGGANVDTYGYYHEGWSKFRRMTYGYGRMHVHNASHMQFEFVQNDQGRVVDSTWIVSDHAWPGNRWRWRRYLIHWDLERIIHTGLLVVVLALLIRMWTKRRRWTRVDYAKVESKVDEKSTENEFLVEPLPDIHVQ